MLGRSLSLTVLLALVALAAACNGGDETPSASPTPLLTATATPVPATATPVPDIREQDLTQHAALQDFIAAGAPPDTSSVIYVDLTEDGVDDAVVPISSGGGTHLAVVVLGYGPDGLEELLRVVPSSRRIRAMVEEGQLVTTEGVFGPNDALCCPSQLLTTWYAWDGSELAIDRRETTQG